jgi:hypothetical protein
MNVSIMPKEDDRNKISKFNSGVYFVNKINMIAQFSFGDSGSFSSSVDAQKALTKYLQKRKDKDSLTVTLIHRNYKKRP